MRRKEMKRNDMVVHRRSGQPMTVKKIQEDHVTCQWFSQKEGLFKITRHKKSQIRSTLDILKPGDVVRVNSGGPAMLLTKIFGNKAHCEWYSQNEREFFRDSFQMNSLDKITRVPPILLK